MKDLNRERPNNGLGSRVDDPFILLLSTSLLVDRVYRYTGLIEELEKIGDVKVWASSFGDTESRNCWAGITADVVINLSSTVTVDAAIFDKPVVNLNFDPQPEKPFEKLVKDVNSAWTHFSPIANSGGVRLVNTPEEMVRAIKDYLANPTLDHEGRKRIVSRVCGYADGKCANRMSQAIWDFARRARNFPVQTIDLEAKS
ncbi:MAG: hypothetical protein WBD16_06265 [Pyrinomonadaceae bacterium]